MQPQTDLPPPAGPPPVVPPVTVPPLPPPPSAPEALPPGVSKADCELLEKDEHVVTVVHRHPIGLIAIYAVTIAAVAAILAVVAFAAPSLLQNLSGQAYKLMIGIVIVVIGFIAMIMLIATSIYRQSRLVVADKSLVQVIQKGLFVRKVSRLSMSNVQDVAADHNGFLATIFNYGTLTVQTAGEEDNFIFTLCPTPDIYAERILDARQAFAKTEEGRQGV